MMPIEIRNLSKTYIPTRLFAVISMCLGLMALSSCSGKPAAPQINPGAHIRRSVTIKVDPKDADAVTAMAVWVMGGDIRQCAAYHLPAGNYEVGQLSTDLKVKKKSGRYLTSVLIDKYQEGSCPYHFGAIAFNFYKKKERIAKYILISSQMARRQKK